MTETPAEREARLRAWLERPIPGTLEAEDRPLHVEARRVLFRLALAQPEEYAP